MHPLLMSIPKEYASFELAGKFRPSSEALIDPSISSFQGKLRCCAYFLLWESQLQRLTPCDLFKLLFPIQGNEMLEERQMTGKLGKKSISRAILSGNGEQMLVPPICFSIAKRSPSKRVSTVLDSLARPTHLNNT
jgi:hypothetical protein